MKARYIVLYGLFALEILMFLFGFKLELGLFPLKFHFALGPF